MAKVGPFQVGELTTTNSIRCIPGDGIGNRFLLIMEGDAIRCGYSVSQLATELCGDEADGLLVVGTANSNGATRISITNRDGSDGGVCLNGLRVAACWTGAESGAFEMENKQIEWRMLEDGIFELCLRKKDIPQEMELRSIHADNRAGVSVPFWNPHAIFPVEDVDEVDLNKLSRAVREQKEQFPEGVNVEVIAPMGEEGLAMRVNERGVGETPSCGSGAVAVALLAWLQGEKKPIGVVMPGGLLALSPTENGDILLAGEARIGPATDRVLGNT